MIIKTVLVRFLQGLQRMPPRSKEYVEFILFFFNVFLSFFLFPFFLKILFIHLRDGVSKRGGGTGVRGEEQRERDKQTPC